MGGVGASKSESKSSSSMEAEASVTQNKDMSKEAALSEKLDKKTTKVQKMVGQMAVNVIRYEMFLKGKNSYNCRIFQGKRIIIPLFSKTCSQAKQRAF